MARARVQLRHCESFVGMTGEAWIKNQARVFTDAKKIGYYKGHPEFVVTDLADPKRAAPKPAPAPSGDDGTGGGDDGGDGGDKLTEAKLKRMSNAELVDLAAERFELALDEDEMKKADLVAAILEAQG